MTALNAGFRAWPDYRRRDIATVPVENKQPLITGWDKWTRPPSTATLERFAARFPNANLAIVPGASRGGLICIDIDDADYTPEAWERFGPTPIVVETPSGGRHLWYRGRCSSANLRKSESIAVDIKSNGAIVLAPPSRRSAGAYEFYTGNVDDFSRLPAIRWAGLPQQQERVIDGQRHEALFNSLRYIARDFADDDFDGLLAEARRMNATYFPPIEDDADVVKTAQSVWKWRLQHPKGAWKENHVLTPNALLLGPMSSDAKVLEMVLRGAHPPHSGRNREGFAISDRAMARDQTIVGWTRERYRNARDELIRAGKLVVVGYVGRSPRYRFMVEDFNLMNLHPRGAASPASDLQERDGRPRIGNGAVKPSSSPKSTPIIASPKKSAIAKRWPKRSPAVTS